MLELTGSVRHREFKLKNVLGMNRDPQLSWISMYRPWEKSMEWIGPLKN